MGTARCQLLRFLGDEAICHVIMDEFDLPQVAFSAKKLAGIEINSKFLWNLNKDKILPYNPSLDELSSEEKQELERLYANFIENHKKDGGVWEEYTGPGK